MDMEEKKLTADAAEQALPVQELPQVLLPLADIQLPGSHMPDGPLLQVLIRQLEQRPGQPFGDVIFDEGLLHRRGKPQQPQLNVLQIGRPFANQRVGGFG